ncbi:MAG: murein biosynthesis integral membrane protein MurJ [Rhodospirillaceae bacterium]|nr:murein biosynthesis integral membrane protein MurJ [Rhodospirillaceae bacterium]|tara:strand:+ start:2254 stop:3816 length:1563 start_codon:yes stop_codon:yes gene_type:complete
MNLARAFVTVSGLTAISRVAGFVRDMLFAAALGAGIAADAFLVAFKLPNFFRRLFAEGAFNAAFIPMFAGRLEGEGKAEAKRLADEVMAVLLLALVVLTLAFEIAMPWVMLGLAPGFTDEPQKFELAIELTRITFPYLLLISLVALYGAMLNSTGRFAAYASAPILLNLCLITAALVAYASPTIGAGHALAWGVTLGGVAQVLLLLANLSRAGLMPRLLLPRLTKGVKQVLRLFGPAALGAGVVQINLVIDLWVASFLPTGSISYLYYADRVNQLPLGVIGIAVGTALLPLLSRQIEADDQAGANDSQSRAVELVMIFCLPAAVALTIIAEPIIAVLFERGAFDAADTAASAAALVAFAVGLPAYVLIKVFAPGFFARKDTKTPVKVAVVGLLSNLAIMLTLIWSLGHVGIALATAGAAWINGGILCFILIRRGHFAPDDRLKHRLPRILFASAAMAAVLWLGVWAREQWLPEGFVADALGLAALVALGLAIYALAGQVLGAFRLGDIRTMMRRQPAASG